MWLIHRPRISSVTTNCHLFLCLSNTLCLLVVLQLDVQMGYCVIFNNVHFTQICMWNFNNMVTFLYIIPDAFFFSLTAVCMSEYQRQALKHKESDVNILLKMLYWLTARRFSVTDNKCTFSQSETSIIHLFYKYPNCLALLKELENFLTKFKQLLKPILSQLNNIFFLKNCWLAHQFYWLTSGSLQRLYIWRPLPMQS